MKLTSRSEYALLALIYLARQEPFTVHPVEVIATAQVIPLKFLEQILLSLRRAGFVRSVRGSRGGYMLAKSPESISIAQIVRLFDGALAPIYSVSRNFYESTPSEREGQLLKVFDDLAKHISDVMERTSIADVSCRTLDEGDSGKWGQIKK